MSTLIQRIIATYRRTHSLRQTAQIHDLGAGYIFSVLREHGETIYEYQT